MALINCLIKRRLESSIRDNYWLLRLCLLAATKGRCRRNEDAAEVKGLAGEKERGRQRDAGTRTIALVVDVFERSTLQIVNQIGRLQQSFASRFIPRLIPRPLSLAWPRFSSVLLPS